MGTTSTPETESGPGVSGGMVEESVSREAAEDPQPTLPADDVPDGTDSSGGIIPRLTQSPYFQGWPLIAGGALMGALLYKVWDVMAPPLLAGLVLYLLYPHRRNAMVVRLMVVTAIATGIWLASETGLILFPFVAAFILAYLFNPVVSRLEGWKIPRELSAGLILVLLFGLSVLAARFFVPGLLDQLSELVRRLPLSISRLLAWLEEGPILGYVADLLDLGDTDNLRVALFDELASQGQNLIQQGFGTLVSVVQEVPTVFNTLGRALEMIAIPFVTFYLLKDFDVLIGHVKTMVPRPYVEPVKKLVCSLDTIIARYLRGQLTVACIMGTATWLLLWTVGVDYALILGLTTGVLNIIPYFGFIVSLVLGILVAFFDPDPFMTVVKVLSIYIALNVLEASFISPRIVGSQVGLHPVWVILSLLVFFHFFGFIGLIVAVPLTAVGSILVQDCYDWYLRSSLYTGRQ